MAAVLIAAAFLLASARLGIAADSTTPDVPVIDTASDVERNQCAPCHLDLGSVNQPGLVFGHGSHLMVACDGCHSRLPHKGGATESVQMDVCFACHGVQHGPQGELATADCETCHTPSFELRPRSHTKNWAAAPHADKSNDSGVNRCMMCHDSVKDCDLCHAEKKLDIPSMPRSYASIITEPVKDPSVKMYPTGPTSMSQCVYCHPDLDAIQSKTLVFAHAAHTERNYKCTSCHPAFGHSAKGPAKPDMLSCYRCHGLQHNTKGLVAGDACYKCHPKTFNLVPDNHTKVFMKGKHKAMANARPEYCAMCHKSEFCVKCHAGKSDSPNTPKKAVVPVDHTKADWKVKHGPIYLARKGACGSCHAPQSCQRCHKTVMPHPTGWIENHKPAPGVTTADCNVCHTDRSACQKCHHQKVAKAELLERNCTPCHEEMKKKPATGMKNKGFAEHAVHFNTGTKRNGKPYEGKPYTCDDCHIGFSTAASSASHTGAASGSLPAAGHDVRLCYGCHGAVDYQNQVIAPYPGAELCLRCHTNLNI